MRNTEFDIEKNTAILYINEKIYFLPVLMKTAYIYIDDFYIFFDYENENIIKIILKSKKDISKKNLKKYIGEFMNELLYQSIRKYISNDTNDLRKIIIARALYGTTINTNAFKIEDSNEIYVTDNNLEDKSDHIEDEENIAVSWFEK